MDDLSIPHNGDVVKPDLCWDTLPALMQQRLRPGGFAVFNLLPPPEGHWNPGLARIVARFGAARIIDLEEFQNRILVVGARLPSARQLGTSVRAALRSLRSRQAGRLRVRTLPLRVP